jgi:hypothetical protein
MAKKLLRDNNEMRIAEALEKQNELTKVLIRLTAAVRLNEKDFDKLNKELDAL